MKPLILHAHTDAHTHTCGYFIFSLVSRFELGCTSAIPTSNAMVLHLGLHPGAAFAAFTCDLHEWGVPYEAWPEKDSIKEWEDKGHYDFRKKGHRCIIQLLRHRTCFMVTRPPGMKHGFGSFVNQRNCRGVQLPKLCRLVPIHYGNDTTGPLQLKLGIVPRSGQDGRST